MWLLIEMEREEMIDLRGIDCLFLVKKDLRRSSLPLLKVLRLVFGISKILQEYPCHKPKFCLLRLNLN